MKSILFVIATLVSFSCLAQKTIPRFGTASNQDATFRNQKMTLDIRTDIAGSTTDTLVFIPGSLHTFTKLTVIDSVSIAVNVKDSWFGDRLTLVVYNTAGLNHAVYLTSKSGQSNNWRFNTNKISLTSAKNAVLQFTFDGAGWIEVGRQVLN